MSDSSKAQTIEAKAWALAEPLLAAEGLELLDVEFVREHGWILRLTIGMAEGREGSVGLDECALASRAVDRALDVEDFIPQEYSLEVSSPGLNRPLRRQRHFEQAVGQRVRVKTFGPKFEPPRKNFLGTLTAVTPEGVVVEVEGAGSFTIPLGDIASANLEYDFDAPEKPGAPKKPKKPKKQKGGSTAGPTTD